MPLPRSLRISWIKRILSRKNCKKVVFWSQAGKKSLLNYGGIDDENFLRKTTVVYPAVRKVSDDLIRFDNTNVNILFSGDFFRKGGVNVVDAFLHTQQSYPSVKLRLCCDEKIDFNTSNLVLKQEYLDIVRSNPGIIFGRASREELIKTILPNTDIFLLPTYIETFGFSVLEAMAFGIPIVATNHFAIPEMVENEVNGLLIDTSQFDCEHLFRGYVVNNIPTTFRHHVTQALYGHLCRLIESAELRKKLGLAGLELARTKFSFETRNHIMLDIYREAVRE
jgi:glycosyltransferase involved in cell wall biosynthesis